MFLSAIAIGHNRLLPFPISRREPDLNIVPHSRTIAFNQSHKNILRESTPINPLTETLRWYV